MRFVEGISDDARAAFEQCNMPPTAITDIQQLEIAAQVGLSDRTVSGLLKPLSVDASGEAADDPISRARLFTGRLALTRGRGSGRLLERGAPFNSQSAEDLKTTIVEILTEPFARGATKVSAQPVLHAPANKGTIARLTFAVWDNGEPRDHELVKFLLDASAANIHPLIRTLHTARRLASESRTYANLINCVALRALQIYKGQFAIGQAGWVEHAGWSDGRLRHTTRESFPSTADLIGCVMATTVDLKAEKFWRLPS